MCDLVQLILKIIRYPISAKIILVDSEYAFLDWYYFIRPYMYSELVYTILFNSFVNQAFVANVNSAHQPHTTSCRSNNILNKTKWV